MKLSQKVIFCRKKAGLSQEALADMIGVSRQAVSKWETGEAAPEISKLLLLAKAFGVTTDWLLSEDDPAAESAPEIEPDAAPKGETPPSSASWVDSVPGMFGRMIKRYGWLYGVYTALGGFVFVVFGIIAKAMGGWAGSNIFDRGSGGYTIDGIHFDADTIWYDEAGNVISSPNWGSSFKADPGVSSSNPIDMVGTLILVIGVIIIIAGAALAIYLKRRSDEPMKLTRRNE